jgi:hypothetical protein
LNAVAIAAIAKHDEEAQKDVYKKLELIVSQGKMAERAISALRGFSFPPK